MLIIDIIILIILAGFVVYGWKSGLISVIGRIAGIFVGVFVAGQYYRELADYFTQISFGSETLQNVIAFIVIFGIVSQVVGLIFYSIDKIFHAVAIIPGLKALNRLLGAIFGLIEGALVVATIVYVIYLFNVPDLQVWLAESSVAAFFLAVATVIEPFIPSSLRALEQFIF
ncbi:MAG: CvpA family protein [Candidatus Komeilibacteria bacterium]|nr:CvpA family protein [Candidatus Komeilibacteria bacterium]